MNENKIILLTEVLDQRLRKQKELEYYQQELEKLQTKMFFVKKEIEVTNIIIDIIQKESVVDLRENAYKQLTKKQD